MAKEDKKEDKKTPESKEEEKKEPDYMETKFKGMPLIKKAGNPR